MICRLFFVRAARAIKKNLPKNLQIKKTVVPLHRYNIEQ